MPKPRFIIALILNVGLLATAALAQRHDNDAPINFGSDRIELQDKANRAVLSGNVSVRQADLTLTSERMTVAYTGQVIGGNPQVSRLDAAGDVVVRRPSQTARSSYAIYDLNRRTITMLGGVSLTQGGNTVNGGRLTINLDNSRAIIDGSAVGSSPGAVTKRTNGRVTGTFSVPDRK